jgi:hypothetical protein
MHCHSTETDVWSKVPDHHASLADVRTDRLSCASPGCHGRAHPYFQSKKALADAPDGGAR